MKDKVYDKHGNYRGTLETGGGCSAKVIKFMILVAVILVLAKACSEVLQHTQR